MKTRCVCVCVCLKYYVTLDNLPWSLCSCMATEHCGITLEHITMENLKTACIMAQEHTPFLMVALIKVNFTRTGINFRKKKCKCLF